MFLFVKVKLYQGFEMQRRLIAKSQYPRIKNNWQTILFINET